MTGIVTKTFLYPIKGLPGIETPTRGIVTDPALGIRGDRNHAIYRKPTDAPTQWKPKGMFWVWMNHQGMAQAVDPQLTEHDLDANYTLDHDLVRRAIAARNLPPDTSLVHTGGSWHLADVNQPYVSFLNLASVRALEEATGTAIDPHRFRMNVWVDGLAPWAELDYITASEEGARFPMQVGDQTLWCNAICERCKAIEQNPATGEWDLELVRLLKEDALRREYPGAPKSGKLSVMGWLATPLEVGVIRAGQEVVLGKN